MILNFLVENLKQSFVDNVLRERVRPAVGGIVYCELAFAVEHSGIYVGNSRIVHLDGDGIIESVSPQRFLDRLDGFNSAISIYVSCRDGIAVGSSLAAHRAKQQVGNRVDYNVALNNCHKFSAGCLTGNFDNYELLFSALKQKAIELLDVNEWRVADL